MCKLKAKDKLCRSIRIKRQNKIRRLKHFYIFSSSVCHHNSPASMRRLPPNRDYHHITTSTTPRLLQHSTCHHTNAFSVITSHKQYEEQYNVHYMIHIVCPASCYKCYYNRHCHQCHRALYDPRRLFYITLLLPTNALSSLILF